MRLERYITKLKDTGHYGINYYNVEGILCYRFLNEKGADEETVVLVSENMTLEQYIKYEEHYGHTVITDDKTIDKILSKFLMGELLS